MNVRVCYHVSICNKLEEKRESHPLDATSKPIVPQAEGKVDLAPRAVSTLTQSYCGLTASDKTTLMQTVVATDLISPQKLLRLD